MTFSGMRAGQRPDEIGPFIDLLNEYSVRSYLEIGAREGDTFHKVVSALPQGSVGVAIDYPGAAWGYCDSREYLEAAVTDLVEKGYEASVIWGDSKAAGTVQLAMTRGPYDAILIDGDHTLEGVTADWKNYRSMGKIIAFHDIDGEGIENKGFPVEVPALWREIKAKHKTIEFVGEVRGMGIGVVLP